MPKIQRKIRNMEGLRQGKENWTFGNFLGRELFFNRKMSETSIKLAVKMDH